MFVEYLKRGVVAGVAAGAVFGLFLTLVATPMVGFADGMAHDADASDHGAVTESEAAHHDATEAHGDDGHEDASQQQQADHHADADHYAGAHAEDGGHHEEGHHESAVPAGVTDVVSVLSGVLWAVLLGGVVFGAGYYLFEPTIPGSEATRSYVLAAAGFLTVSGAPWLVLPPLPPGTEQSLGTDLRLALYGGMMLAGALVCLLSFAVYGRLQADHGSVVASVAALLPLGLLAVPPLLVPTNGGQVALPATLSTGLTGTIVFGQALLWLLLAAAHTGLRRRAGDAPQSGPYPGGHDLSALGD